jgi:transcriptional regulator with XRE-family HTH domain
MLAWTMEELANRSGLSRRTLVSFESELRTPHAQNLRQIEGAFGEAGVRFLTSETGEGVFLTLVQ